MAGVYGTYSKHYSCRELAGISFGKGTKRDS